MDDFDTRMRERAQREDCPVPKGFDGRVERAVAVLPRRKMWHTGTVRAGLMAAAICVLVGTTALAYALGAFEFLKGREEYQFLGQTEVYEKYAKPVNLSQTADNGDVLTIESMAMDGSFCTLVYQVETVKAMNTWSDINRGISKDAPDFWQALVLNPSFHIGVGGDLPGADGGQQGQQFLADANTLCGITRIELERPIAKGESFTIQVGPSLSELQTDPTLGEIEDLSDVPDKWSFDLVADPLESEVIPIEGGTLICSPLWTVLKSQAEILGDNVVLRDADTGVYIPYGYAFNVVGPEDNLYELYGDTSKLKNLEIIPIRQGESRLETADLEALPARGDNPAGDYEVSSVEIGEDQIVVRQRPVGAAPRSASRVEFVDANENVLFYGTSFKTYSNTFTDWTDGSVVTTYSLGGVPKEYVARIAGIRYIAHSYALLEDEAVIIPLK